MADADPERPLAADLAAVARASTEHALALTMAGPGLGQGAARAAEAAASWALCARHALEALRLAPVEGAPMDDGERVAAAAMVAELRDRDRLHSEFLHELHGTFASADTPTAARIAGRIVQHMQLVEAEAR